MSQQRDMTSSFTVPPALAGIPLRVDALVRTAAERWGSNPFLLVDGGVARTFEQLDEAVNRVAHGLLADGLSSMDRVAIMADNVPEYLDAWFGVSRAGGVEVSVNTAFEGAPLRYLLEQSGASTAVVQGQYVDAVLAERERLPDLRRIWVIGEHAAVGSGAEIVRPYSELVADHAVVSLEVDDRAMGMLGYTSGTTGRSKGVMIPHRRMVASARDMVAIREISTDDVLYTCLPLFHGNAKILTALPALAAGSQLALGSRFSASGFWPEIRACGATQLNYLGVMVAILNKADPSSLDRDHSVRLAWGAGAPEQAMRAFEERFGIVLLEGYGLTETGVVLSSTRSDRTPGRCGRPVAGYQVEVVDAHDEILPEGVGEIVVRPERPYTTMLGYWGYPNESLEAFRNCWVHTGDLGRRHADGSFSFVDRQKDALRRRGENISSFEVEDVLNQHPDVLESAVFPVRSELTEDDVMATVVVKHDATLTAQQLLDYCVREMPAFWVPRYLELTTEPLPRTPTNKVEKYRLVQRGSTAATWDREAEDHHSDLKLSDVIKAR